MDRERGEGGTGGGEGESGEAPRTPADSEALFTRIPAQNPTQHGQSDLQGPQDLVPDEEAGEDAACGVGVAEEDDEQRRRLALSCPPVVTYGTYRGNREITRIRRRNHVQVDSPISEGEEMQQSGSGSAAKLSPSGRRTRAAATLGRAGSGGEGSRALAGDADTATPAGPGLGGVPVTMPSENSVSQSALHHEQEPDPARAQGQTTADSRPGALSAAILSAAQKESSDEQPSPAVAENKAHRTPAESLEERTAWAMAETIAEAKKAGTEWAETLSVREGSTGSPSKADDALPGKVGGAQGTALAHQPVTRGDAATQSRNHGSQLDPRCVSLSGTQEAEDSEGPVPADRGADVQESALAAGKSPSEFLAAEMGSIEDTGPAEEALWFESRRMVDNILRNALVALQNIESRERENRDKEAIVPDGFFKPERLQEGGLSEPADATRLPVSVEQSLGLSGASLDGNRSALSSGYESIVGSDTDIRKSLGFSSDLGSVGASVSISDLRQGKQCPVERPQVLHPAELHESYSGDYSSCRSEETDPQSDGNINFVFLNTGESDASMGDNKGYHCIPNESKLVSLSVGNLEADNGEVTRISNNVSEPPDSISGKVNKANLQTYQVSSDPFTGAISTEGRGEAISKDLHLAKDGTESNNKSHNLTSSSKEIVPSHQQEKVHGELEMPKGDPEKPKFNGVKDESSLSIQLAGNTMDTKTFQREAQSKDTVQPSTFAKLELKNIDEQQILPTGSEPSQSSEEAPIRYHPTENEAITDCMGKNKVLQDRAEAGLNSCDDVCQMDRNGTRDLQELCDDEKSAGDQSFALVESYLATVVEDELETGVKGNTSSHARPGRADANGKQETPEDPERQESPVSCTALGSDDDDAQQWRAVKAYRCHVLAEEGLGSEAQEHGAGASFRDDVSSRSSGHGAAGKRTHPDLSLNASRGEPSGPYIHRLHEMDFHECEGGFAIINEEEEADAVFVNDTGAMLSPTTRRAKAYPFSLSPIFEEENGREEAPVGDLQEPPATEEDLRSVEQQASSILSLLQSVSERLQSSAFADPYRDSEDFPPMSQQPPWESLSDRAGEGQDALPRSPSDGREGSPHYVNDEADSFGLVDRLAGRMQDALPNRAEDSRFPPRSDFTAVSNSPFYEYLKSARCQVPKPDADDNPPHSEVKLCHGDEGSSAPVLTKVCKNSEKLVPRPTQVHIYSGVTFSGEKREFHSDVEDTTGMAFPRGASARVLRGCWLLYREPGFRGPCVVLEEGETVLSQAGGLSCPGSSPTAVAIGSIRRVVKDHGAPEILIRPRDARGGTPRRLCAAADDLGAPGSVRLSSLGVASGCWVAYDGAGFEGNCTVLEAGGPVTPGPHGHLVTCVRSLRPLRMGGLKVQRPTDPKMVVYEQPCFGGQSRELWDHTPDLGARHGVRGAASLRVVGGVWVGYSAKGYAGRQYLLEEGECRDCLELGGSDQTLLSFRFLQADFIEPSVSLRSGLDQPHATETDIADLDVPDLEQAGSAGKTDSICVRSGVWVAYSERSFCGKQHVLEKGTHAGDLDWGGTTGAPASIRPVRTERFGSGGPTFLIQAYSQPHYQGDSQEYDTEVPDCASIVPMSFRVIRGSWLLFEDEGCAGNQFVLGEGLYPDLISCGCVATSIKSFKPVPRSFSDPSISLYSLESFEGLETIALTHKDSMSNFFTQSVRVNSGLWVVYEYGHFKGRQMLLHSGEFATWGDHSGWDTIGSLHPLRQPRAYIQVRSRALGSVLTAVMSKDDASPANVSLDLACGLDTQCWVFTEGLLKCKAGKACLSVIGGKASPGARVALWSEHGRAHQKWSLNENGTISSHLSHNLVLDFKGGKGFEKDHLVASEFTANQITQYWDIEMV